MPKATQTCSGCGVRSVLSTAIPMADGYKFVFGSETQLAYGSITYGTMFQQPKLDPGYPPAVGDFFSTSKVARQWMAYESPPVCPSCELHVGCGCCECEQCEGCDSLFSDDAPKCERCESCDDCCGCQTCDGCGSKASEYAEWCSNCEYLSCCCECAHCDNCGQAANASDIHYGCGYGDNDSCGCCECYSSEDDCECDDCTGVSGGGGGMGTTDAVEWHSAAQTATERASSRRKGATGPEYWGFTPATFDPARAMADYFLLHAIDGVALPTGWNRASDSGIHVTEYKYIRGKKYGDRIATFYVEEAKATLKALVAEADRNFTAYADMAIGGELRYHRAVKRAMGNVGRSEAWAAWKEIRADVGPKALQDAADLFDEIDNGSYGGPKWAMAARLLHRRVTGVINADTFVNLTFALQHNGGSFLNKVNWKVDNAARFDLESMKSVIGPAHSGAHGDTAWSVLMLGASPAVRDLFRDAWKYGNEVRRGMGRVVERVPGRMDCLRRNGTRRDASVVLPDGTNVWYLKDAYSYDPFSGSGSGAAPGVVCKYGIPGCPGC